MALITKSDLKYKYNWTATPGDNPKKTGSPDNDLLNRSEGYEVLDYINALASEWNLKQKDSGLKIEMMIHEKVPSNIHSRIKIKAWIAENWKK